MLVISKLPKSIAGDHVSPRAACLRLIYTDQTMTAAAGLCSAMLEILGKQVVVMLF